MTKDLHPELGSGALREALEQIASITCSCHDSANADWHGKRCPKGIALAALSLSSPIEPERCPTCTSSIRNIKAGLAYGVLEPGACPDIWHAEPQASSEVRERVERAIEELNTALGAFDLGGVDVVKRYMERRVEELQAALAPSRQGAGGK